MLKNLKLKNFCNHSNQEFNFREGLNLIIGENRKGKSNILESICFALFGQTKYSTLSKIIQKGKTKAEVNLDDTIIRIRQKSKTELLQPSKIELENKLNLSYQEFLRIFYISTNDFAKLFDGSYFRDFLIKLFDLEKYLNKYKEFSIEYRNLKNLEVPQIDKEKEQNKLKSFINLYKTKKEKYDNLKEKLEYYRNLQIQINRKIGTINSKIQELKSKYNLLNEEKCPTCLRKITDVYRQRAKKKLDKIKEKIGYYNSLLTEKLQKVSFQLNTLNSQISPLENDLINIQHTIGEIKGKLSLDIPQKDEKRLKELEQLISFFNPNGFPSYLLQIYIPAIQETANSFISFIFPDTSIEIQTTKPESNIPKIKILVKEKDREGYLEDFAASQNVIVNLCLRLAIIVLFKQLKNTEIDFLMIDEGLDKLSYDNQLKVIKLLENFIDWKYLNKVILVSHRLELKNINCNLIELK